MVFYRFVNTEHESCTHIERDFYGDPNDFQVLF